MPRRSPRALYETHSTEALLGLVAGLAIASQTVSHRVFHVPCHLSASELLFVSPDDAPALGSLPAIAIRRVQAGNASGSSLELSLGNILQHKLKSKLPPEGLCIRYKAIGRPTFALPSSAAWHECLCIDRSLS